MLYLSETRKLIYEFLVIIQISPGVVEWCKSALLRELFPYVLFMRNRNVLNYFIQCFFFQWEGMTQKVLH